MGSTRITETGLAARNRRAGFPAPLASVPGRRSETPRHVARSRRPRPASTGTPRAGSMFKHGRLCIPALHSRGGDRRHSPGVGPPREAMSASALRRKPGSDKGLTPSANRPAVSFPPLALAALLFSLAALPAQSNALADLERAAAANPSDVQAQRRLAAAYEAAGRRLDAAAAWTRVTDLAPQAPSGWYALGLAYNAVAQEAVRSFEDRPADAAWRQLLIADSLLATGHLTDAFVIYRSVEEQLPSMVTIHESVAQIYERSGHAAWAATERTRGVLSADACATRKALCEFRAGRYRGALEVALGGSDAESRYWLARIARELARASYAHLDTLADSPERRASRATIARAEDRHQDAVDGTDRRAEAGAWKSHARLRARDGLLCRP